MAKKTPEPLKGAVRPDAPAAKLLGEDEIEALIANGRGRHPDDVDDDDEEKDK